MDLAKLGTGYKIAAGSAVALFIIMFFPWYGVGGESGIGSGNAWEWFSFIDILLFLVIAVTIGLVAAAAANALPRELPAPPSVIIAGAGALATVLILFRLLSTPGPDSLLGVDIEVERKIGVFLGLLASAAIGYGGYSAMSEPASAGPAPTAGSPPPAPPPSSPPPPGA